LKSILSSLNEPKNIEIASTDPNIEQQTPENAVVAVTGWPEEKEVEKIVDDKLTEVAHQSEEIVISLKEKKSAEQSEAPKQGNVRPIDRIRKATEQLKNRRKGAKGTIDDPKPSRRGRPKNQ